MLSRSVGSVTSFFKSMKGSHLFYGAKALAYTYTLVVLYVQEILTLSAWIYLAFYSSLIISWSIKHWVFPNKPFERDLIMSDFVSAVLVIMGIYWLVPMFVIYLNREEPLQPLVIFGSVVSFIVGLVTIMVSDAETFWMLSHNPQSLITGGMRRYIRHPNYLGEGLVYLSFALLSRSIWSILVLAMIWIVVFVPHNLAKEERLSKYETEWDDYVGRTGLYFPPIIDPVTNFLLSGPAEVESIIYSKKDILEAEEKDDETENEDDVEAETVSTEEEDSSDGEVTPFVKSMRRSSPRRVVKSKSY
jgi:protein-S-isoprenylcysteine O-methyltransferase Ste14